MSRLTSEKKRNWKKTVAKVASWVVKGFPFLHRHRCHHIIDKKEVVCILSSLFVVFADSSSCRRRCQCPSPSYLSSCVFHEWREEWWRDVGGYRSAVVLHDARSINIYFYLEDWEWKPRNPGETHEVWRGFWTKTSWSAEVKQTLLDGDTLWCWTQSRISNQRYFSVF